MDLARGANRAAKVGYEGRKGRLELPTDPRLLHGAAARPAASVSSPQGRSEYVPVPSTSDGVRYIGEETPTPPLPSRPAPPVRRNGGDAGSLNIGDD